MGKKISQFKFKQFSVSHHRSSMKVGVDGVLIGCWTEVSGVNSILDVGTGCGLIALILCQRCPEAKVMGIDIDSSSVQEALENVRNSLWSDRVNIICGDVSTDLNWEQYGKFDLIISNPPFFDSGVTTIVTPRERARHQGSLSPSSLLSTALPLLSREGMLAMVVPAEMSSSLEEEAHSLGYTLIRKCLVRGHEGAPYKRSLLQWCLSSDKSESVAEKYSLEHLTLESSLNVPTEQYRKLCKDFYLKF